ncbi:hypothetical protein ACNOYE_19720 [Nannocystaceae bacterium ST9]
MITIPAELVEGLPPGQHDKARAWWESLTPGAQTEFGRLWDSRSEDTALHGITREGEIEWHELPIELRGEIVDEQDLADQADEAQAHQDLLEYICGHEEIHFFLTERSFHLCRAHARAREVVRAGWLPSGFECPLADANCPMRRVLVASAGKSLRLRVALAGRR